MLGINLKSAAPANTALGCWGALVNNAVKVSYPLFRYNKEPLQQARPTLTNILPAGITPEEFAISNQVFKVGHDLLNFQI